VASAAGLAGDPGELAPLARDEHVQVHVLLFGVDAGDVVVVRVLQAPHDARRLIAAGLRLDPGGDLQILEGLLAGHRHRVAVVGLVFLDQHQALAGLVRAQDPLTDGLSMP
jgi:hypothetical protein